MRIETVKIESGDSYSIINQSDFDPKVHKRFGETKLEKVAEVVVVDESGTGVKEVEEIHIPKDWENDHWRRQVKLAETIRGDKIKIDKNANEKAFAIIAAEVKARKNK